LKSNKTHVQTSSDSESVDDIQAALFVNHLDARSRDGEERPIKEEIDT
jgi:hypothetical protein